MQHWSNDRSLSRLSPWSHSQTLLIFSSDCPTWESRNLHLHPYLYLQSSPQWSTGVRIRHSIAWYWLPSPWTQTSVDRIGLSIEGRCLPPIDSIGGGIVNDHRGEQVVVLARNLQIGGSAEGRIHLDSLAISIDINHVRFMERCG